MPKINQYRFAIVTSRFNEAITQLLLQGCLSRLTELSIPESNISSLWVPGAIEIPVIAQQCARLRQFDAIICLGAVIRGETGHYDYVCQQVSYGCQRVALTQNIPVIFGVLTTENKAQALERVGGARGHMGREAVDTAVEMIGLMHQFALADTITA